MKDRHDLIWNIVFGLVAIWNMVIPKIDETWVGSDGWKTLTLIWFVLLARMIVSFVVPDCENIRRREKDDQNC